MFAKLKDVESRYHYLNELLSDPQVLADQEAYRRYTKESAQLTPLINTYQEYQTVDREITHNKELLNDKDPDIRELAKEELATLKPRLETLEQDLKVLLLPRDPNDEKNIILEIRAGTGGDEAALFAADVFRMYSRFAEAQGWKVEILSHHPTGIGGFKEIIANIEGRGAYSLLKYESGVHRVQRVPSTEAQGRIHTSAITVAILAEAEEVEVEIKPEDLRVDVYRSTGHGGQSVNTTDSAVRMTHLPTGLVVTCQDEKSQFKNKAKALKVLRARLLDKMQSEQEAEISANRRQQVGSGDRSERIRTYNFPQNRLTDHRIGLTLYKLDLVLAGDLDQVVHPLIAHYQAEALKQAEN